MRDLLRSPTKTAPLRRVLATLAAGYLAWLRRAGRWDYRRTAAGALLPPEANAPQPPRRPVIIAFWHGRLQLVHDPWIAPEALTLLASEHRDGRLIGDVARHFGHPIVHVARKRGAGPVLRRLARELAAGRSVGITPDGPRGPRMRAKPGVIRLAQMSGAPILPVSAAVRRGRLLHSWDRFLLPWPVNRGVVIWGAPLEVPREADAAAREALRRELVRRLNALSAEADSACGRIPVEPAPERAPAPPGAASADGGERRARA